MNILNTVIQIVYSDTLHNRACCSSAWEKAPMPTSIWLHCMIILLKHDHKCTIVQTVQRRGRYRVEQKRRELHLTRIKVCSIPYWKDHRVSKKLATAELIFLKRWINRHSTTMHEGLKYADLGLSQRQQKSRMFWRQKKVCWKASQQCFSWIRVQAFLRVSKHVLKMLRGKHVSLAKKGENESNKNNHGEVLHLNERISAKLINTSSNIKMYHVKRPQDCG